MRPFIAALLAPSFAVALTAQTPRTPAPILQTATVDVASAFQQHYRAMIEPLVFGRFTIGLSGEYTTDPGQSPYGYAYPVGECNINTLCTDVVAYGQGSGYRAWSFNVHGRWYPRALSSLGKRQSIAAYVGEFIGFHERRTSQPVYYGCPACEATPPPRADTAVFGIANQAYPVSPSVYTQVMHGWEPGAELGVRVLPMHHVVLDIGARFRLARIEDYQSGTRPGGVDSRLVVALGVGW